MRKYAMGRWHVGGLVVLLMITLLACGEEDNQPAPTAPVTIEPTELVQNDTATPSITPGGPTQTPSSTFRPTITPAAPTNTVPANTVAPPTNTPEPYQVRIQQGNTCLEFALIYDVSVEAIEAANPTLNCTALQLDNVIVVPRPSTTPTPFGQEMTATAFYEALVPSLRDVTPFSLYEYCAEEGDTLRSISLKNSTTDIRVCELNPPPEGLDCGGCEFRESGQASCPNPPNVSIGECYTVPGPTYTPTGTNTPSGAATITPTPTHVPPQAVLPGNVTVVTSNTVRLVWTHNSSQLLPGQVFMVTVFEDETMTIVLQDETRETSLLLPDALRPALGTRRALRWTVQVVSIIDDLPIPASAASQPSMFVWQP